MEVREQISSAYAHRMNTAEMRENFLIKEVFTVGKVIMTYSHVDRMIIGGIVPVDEPLEIPVGKELGSSFFLERREMGIINIGGAGNITVDGTLYELDSRDGLYLGKGTKDIVWESKDRTKPAEFYFNSAPAHRACQNRLVNLATARKVALGSVQEGNKRVINQYIHPEVLESCQLVMGMTILDPLSLWNTMPPHTHERRMEVYLYFDMPEDGVVFHMFGKPNETRHLVVRNEQAVISPSWSIHAGVGTSSYTFIWGMAGENQDFDDTDTLVLADLL